MSLSMTRVRRAKPVVKAEQAAAGEDYNLLLLGMALLFSILI